MQTTVDDIKIFRFIEKYVKNPDKELKDWAILALQESKMLIEGSLLDENQIFISTGLGGKNSKLRYSIVLILRNNNIFNNTQKKIIKNEFDFISKKHNSEIEEIIFEKKYSFILILIPLSQPIDKVLTAAISECNQYGDFLNENFIVTNVKKLSVNDMKESLNKKTDDNAISEFIN